MRLCEDSHVHSNMQAVYPDMKMNDKLMEGTLLKLPLREGSGDSKREIKVLCKVQAVKNILTFTMKETEPIKALKRRVYGKEDIPVKQGSLAMLHVDPMSPAISRLGDPLPPACPEHRSVD